LKSVGTENANRLRKRYEINLLGYRRGAERSGV
jgi:hypothetical protein